MQNRKKNPAALERSTRLAPAHTNRHAASSGGAICVLQLCTLSGVIPQQPARQRGACFGDWTAVEGWPQYVAAASGSTGGGRDRRTKRTVNTKGTAERRHDGGKSSCCSRSRESGVLSKTSSTLFLMKQRNFFFVSYDFLKLQESPPPACRTQVSGLQCPARTSRILFRERCWNAQKGTCQRAELCGIIQVGIVWLLCFARFALCSTATWSRCRYVLCWTFHM